MSNSSIPLVQSLLVLSTKHLHPDTLKDLEKYAKDQDEGISYDFPGHLDLLGPEGVGCGILWQGFDCEGGRLVPVAKVAQWPDLAEIRGLAYGLGCTRVLLDPDAAVHPLMPVYEHDQEKEAP